MATTAVSSTTSTATTTATTTSAKSSAAKLITSLGSGSGVDTNALAQSLADSEISPQKALINDKVTQAQNRISGYSAIKYVLGNLQTAFTDLKNQSSFSSLTPTNSQPNAVSITATGAATTGNHTVVVTSLATAEKKLSNGFTSGSVSLNGGRSFNLSLSVHGATATSITIPDGFDTPGGIVGYINAASAGVTAQLINTGDATNPYKIMVTGSTGAANDFTLTSPLLGVSFGTTLQTAANGNVNVDGMALQPTKNTLTDLIPGTTIQFLTSTTGAGANIGLTRDVTSVTTKLQTLVSSYNEAVTMLNTVTDSKSTVPTYGGTLVGNSLVNTLRTQMRAMFFTDSNSPAGNLKNLRDIGFSVDKVGVLTLDNTKLSTALTGQFDNVVTLLSANREGLSSYSTQTAGVAGEAVKSIANLLSSTGSISTQSANQTTSIANYQKNLARLDTRMTQILARYTQQLAAMDSIVGQTKSMQTSLTNTFAGMSAMYTNK